MINDNIFLLTETFEVDTSNTKRLLEGERGKLIRERDVIVSGSSTNFMTKMRSFFRCGEMDNVTNTTYLDFFRSSGNLVCLLLMILLMFKKRELKL